MKKIVLILAPALALAACDANKTPETTTNTSTTQVLDNGTVATSNSTTTAH